MLLLTQHVASLFICLCENHFSAPSRFPQKLMTVLYSRSSSSYCISSHPLILPCIFFFSSPLTFTYFFHPPILSYCLLSCHLYLFSSSLSISPSFLPIYLFLCLTIFFFLCALMHFLSWQPPRYSSSSSPLSVSITSDLRVWQAVNTQLWVFVSVTEDLLVLFLYGWLIDFNLHFFVEKLTNILRHQQQGRLGF